jgi:hypothetical protein
MGNFHCVPSDCATVSYREYLGGKIRWRYGSEPWQEILGNGLTYTTETINNLTQNTSYQLVYRQPIVSNGLFQGWSSEFTSGIGTHNGITSWRMRFVLNGGAVVLTNPFCTFFNGDPGIGNRNCQIWVDITSQGVTTNRLIGSSTGSWGLRVQQTNSALRSTSCIFKIFNNGTEIRTETRSTCPQVEVIPCSLSPELKKIEIKKLPYLERVEVRNQSINVFSLVPDAPPLIDVSPLPPECLNVYLTYTLAPPLLSDYVPLPGIINPYQFVAQICSAPGCPPPVYDVICDDCCDKCPDYTCPIECGDHVCCYNDYGVSVQTIPKDRYCGGAL